MTKNKLEKKFRESLNADSELWGMKLHNNMLAHQTTPGDFIIDYVKDIYEESGSTHLSLNLHLVECKQVTCDENGKGRLKFSRLKQMHDLMAFQQRREGFHFSWFCIAFKERFWASSDIYLIPAEYMKELVESSTNMSINREEFKRLFKHKVHMKNGFIDLTALKC